MTPKLLEVGKVYQPIAIRLAEGETTTLELTNRHAFTPLDAFFALWEITEDGRKIRDGVLEVPALMPGKTLAVPLALGEAPPLAPGAEYHLRVSFHTKEDAPWAEAGHVVASEQMLLPWEAPPRPLPDVSTPLPIS